MTSFVINLFDAEHEQRINDVISFVGEDASGSFGLLPNHARFMTTLVFGLARFQCKNQDWRYLALPGAVLYFCANELTISTRHYLVDSDLERISTQLDQQLITEEENLRATRENLRRMEQAMMKHIMTLKRKMSWMQ